MHVSVGYRTLKEFSHDLPNMLFSRERAYVNGMQGCIHDKLGYRVPHAKAHETVVEQVQSLSSLPC